MNNFDPFWLPPGATYPVTIERYRRWWQFWKPQRWLERATAVVPPPEHVNCRCVIAPHIEGDRHPTTRSAFEE